MPLAADRELRDDPEQMVEQIMELRMLARVKKDVDGAKAADEIPKGPMATRVQEAATDLWRERQQTR